MTGRIQVSNTSPSFEEASIYGSIGHDSFFGMAVGLPRLLHKSSSQPFIVLGSRVCQSRTKLGGIDN